RAREPGPRSAGRWAERSPVAGAGSGWMAFMGRVSSARERALSAGRQTDLMLGSSRRKGLLAVFACASAAGVLAITVDADTDAVAPRAARSSSAGCANAAATVEAIQGAV